MKKLFIFLFLFTFLVNAETYQHSRTFTNTDDDIILNPWGLALTDNDNLIVASGAATSFDHIAKLDENGNEVTRWSSHGTDEGEFDGPLYVDIDENNRIFVTDYFNSRVQVFDSTGKFLFAWGSYGSGTNEFIRPTGIAIDGQSVYVADQGNCRIQKFQLIGGTTQFELMWGSVGNTNGQFQAENSSLDRTGLQGITTDENEMVYVVDGGNYRIQVFNSDGVFIRKWGFFGSAPGGFGEPYGIDIDNQQNVWVADYMYRRLYQFTTNGSPLRYIREYNERLHRPIGLVCGDNTTIYAGDRTKHKIEIYCEGTPQFAGLPPVKIGREQQEMSFVVLAVDPNYNNLFYSISNAPPGSSLLPKNGTNWFRWTPGAGDAGVYQVGFHVYDDGSPIASNFSVVTISVIDTNHPPTISTSLPFSPYSILEGQNLQFNIICFDSDYDVLQLVSNGTPDDAEIFQLNNTNYLFNWTPDFDAGSISGTDYPMTFWAVDNGIPNLSNSVSVTITVISTNDPPRISPLSDKFLNENELLNFNVIASDPDGDNLSFAVSNAPLNSTFSQVNATNYLFSWIPGFTDAGIYSNLEFYVTDDSLTPATVIEKINIVVSNVNRSPVLNIDDVIIDEGSNWVMEVVATDSDVDDILTYSAFGFVARAVWSNNCFEWSPNYTESGIYSDWKVIVNDGTISVTDSFSVTVNEINDPPILGALTNWIIGEGQLLHFPLLATDVNDDILVFSISNAPPEAVVTNFNGTNSFYYLPDYYASHAEALTPTITVTEQNEFGWSDSGSFEITVTNVNRPPELSLPNVNIDEGSNWVMAVIATDPDTNDVLYYFLQNIQEDAVWSVYNGTNYIKWTPGYDESGIYPDWKVIVNDGHISVTDSFSVTVNEINDPPILGVLTNWIIGEGQLLHFPLLATDVNDDILVFSISNAPPEAVVTNFNGTNSFYYLPDYQCSTTVSVVNVTVTEQNEFGWSDSGQFEITVTNVNRAATWLPPNSSYSIKEGEKLEFNIEAADLDTNDIISVVVGNLPEGAEFSDNGLQTTGYETFSWLPNYSQAGVYSDLIFYLMENNITVASQKVTITVTENNLAPELSGPGEIFGIENQEISFAITGTPHFGYSINFTITNTPNFKFQVSNNIFSVSWTPSFLDAGYYTNIIIYAWEEFPDRPPETNSFPMSLIITNVNHAPLLVAPENKTWYAGISYTLQLIASDSDSDDQLTFSVINNPQSLSIAANTGLISCTPIQSDMGFYSNIIFTVTDNGGREEMPGSENLSSSVVFNLIIKGTNEPPIISFQKHSATDWETAFGSVDTYEKQLIRIKIPRNDINNDELKIEVTEMPEGAAFDTNTWILAWIPSYNQSDESGRNFSVTVKDFGDPPQQSADSLNIKIHDIPVQLLKDNQFYDEDWDTVSIKYKTKADGTINIRDPKNLKITGGGEKDLLTIKAVAKNNSPIGITQKGNKNFDVENIFSDSSLKSIKITGSLKGLDVEQLKKLIISQDISGKIQTEKNLETIIVKNSITEAELIIGGSESNSFSAAVKKIFAKNSIENSKIKIGLAENVNITNTLSIGSLNLLKTKLLLNSTIATGAPKTKSGKEIKIKSKEIDNSTLFKTTEDSVEKILLKM